MVVNLCFNQTAERGDRDAPPCRESHTPAHAHKGIVFCRTRRRLISTDVVDQAAHFRSNASWTSGCGTSCGHLGRPSPGCSEPAAHAGLELCRLAHEVEAPGMLNTGGQSTKTRFVREAVSDIYTENTLYIVDCTILLKMFFLLSVKSTGPSSSLYYDLGVFLQGPSHILERHTLRVQTIRVDSHCRAPLRPPLPPAARILTLRYRGGRPLLLRQLHGAGLVAPGRVAHEQHRCGRRRDARGPRPVQPSRWYP